MENKLIVGNMKMNLTYEEIVRYLNNFNETKDNVVICPTSIYVPLFLDKQFKVGLQNVFYKDMGAYTGEISPKQAKSLGISYVIIGHSERRQILKETDETINLKIIESLNSNLKVILCIGETLDERQNNQTNSVIKNQLTEDLKNVNETDNLIIAYEPIWAIGTGLTPTNSEIKETIDFINSTTEKLLSKKIPVLYGGSVTDENIEELNTISNVSGFLVGGASTKADTFTNIIKEVLK